MTLGTTALRRSVLLLAAAFVLTLAPTANAQPSLVDAAKGPRRFTIDTNLRSPSGLSAWAIDRYLLNNTPLPAIGGAFKAAELEHGVNARYLLAHAMLETAFGTSYFALHYRNLFGWTAFDRDPSKYATRFKTYGSGIDLVARRISEYYLTPGGKFYGGAPTLRGMHMYASDPQWEAGIARIANSIVIPTLAGRRFEVATPTLKGSLLAGGKSTATVTIRPTDGGGPLPDGLRIAARWRPVSIVETSNPAKKAPELLPAFILVSGKSAKGTIKASLVAPKLPGRYRLELQLRDSDGTPFGDGTRIVIPGVQARVHATDAVAYALDQTDDGVRITLVNVGRKPIAALGEADDAGAPALTTVAVWSLPRSGDPALLTRIPLAADIAPGKRWTGVIPPDALAPALPGIILIRLEVAGSPNRFITSPPGVFQLDVVGKPAKVTPPDPNAAAAAATPAPTPSAAAVPTPSVPQVPVLFGPSPTPDGSNDPAPTPSTEPSPSAGADPSAAQPSPSTVVASASAAPSAIAAPAEPVVLPTLRIRTVTPADPASAVLLKAKPAVKAAPAKAATTVARTPTRAAVTTATAATPADKPVKAIRYDASVTLLAGTGTVRLTNTGNITYHAIWPPVVPPVAGATGTATTTAHSQTELVLSAVPATGTVDAPITVRIPLAVDLAPGESAEVAIALPALPGVQPSFLVTVRLDTAQPEERPTSAALVFWMRGAPPAPKVAVADPATDPNAVPAAVQTTITKR